MVVLGRCDSMGCSILEHMVLIGSVYLSNDVNLYLLGLLLAEEYVVFYLPNFIGFISLLF